MKKKLLVAATVFVVVLILAAALVFAISQAGLKKLAAADIQDVDLATLADGVYSGKCAAFPISVTVEVRIADRSIAEVRLLKHVNGQGAAAEIIPERVVQAQSLDVDIVTGATYSCKAILMAIENAFHSARN